MDSDSIPYHLAALFFFPKPHPMPAGAALEAAMDSASACAGSIRSQALVYGGLRV